MPKLSGHYGVWKPIVRAQRWWQVIMEIHGQIDAKLAKNYLVNLHVMGFVMESWTILGTAGEFISENWILNVILSFLLLKIDQLNH